MSERRYYSVPDTRSVSVVPQPIQHLAIADAARRAGGAIVFYTMEDFYTTSTHEVILGKLLEHPAVDGIVFYRLKQFVHDGRPQIDVLRRILTSGYEVVFARERLHIADEAQLDREFPLLFASAHVEERDARRGSFARRIAGAT